MDLNGSIFDAINDLAGHVTLLDDAMKFAAQYLIFGAVALVIASWFIRSGGDESRRVAVYTSVVTAVLSIGAVMVIHHFYTHPRPFVQRHDVVMLIKHSADSSFPSDHATVAFALAAGIAMYRLRYGLLLGALALLIGFARIFVGVHYPFDILGGAAVGVTIALVLRGARPLFEWLDEHVVVRLMPTALQ